MVIGIEYLVVRFLGRVLGGLLIFGQERSDRFAVRLCRRHRNELPFRVVEVGELAPEHTAGVDVHRAVEPVRFGDGRVVLDAIPFVK